MGRKRGWWSSSPLKRRLGSADNEAAVDALVTTAFVDTAGAYVLQALPTGAYDVEAFAAGYSTLRIADVDVQAEQDHSEVNFTLTPLNE